MLPLLFRVQMDEVRHQTKLKPVAAPQESRRSCAAMPEVDFLHVLGLLVYVDSRIRFLQSQQQLEHALRVLNPIVAIDDQHFSTV